MIGIQPVMFRLRDVKNDFISAGIDNNDDNVGQDVCGLLACQCNL
jgi:hypothetical protein